MEKQHPGLLLKYGFNHRYHDSVREALRQAREGAPHNILVNAIHPGYTQTSLQDKFPKPDLAARIAMIPLKRIGQPEETARLALFLESERGNYITGEVFAVSGGE